MAVTASPPTRAPRQRLLWSRLHFVVRLLGLTGALVACAGLLLVVVHLRHPPAGWSASWTQDVDRTFHRQTLGDVGPDEAAWLAGLTWRLALLVFGSTVAGLALLVEVVAVLVFATRRSAFGLGAVVQTALAAVLLIAVNSWSFLHHERFDCTRDRQFTLPAEVRTELARLDPHTRTTVIVYQRHKTFGALTDKPADDYDSAAERKVVEKVKDLAEQFRAIGPQVRVEVLDVQARDYKGRLTEVIDGAVREEPPADEGAADRARRDKRLADQAASLRRTIESAPENSLFFYAKDDNHKPYVQRLSFNDFYLLDKTASQDDRGGRGNLVLLYQGIEPFARRLLHLQERRPRVGIAVIHKVLTSTSDHDWGLRGLRQALEARGFEVEDIVLKKWSRFAPPSAAAATADESALERLEERQTSLERLIANLERQKPLLEKNLAVWKEAVTDQKARDRLTRQLADQLGDRKVTAELARFQAAVLQAGLDDVDKALPLYRQRLDEAKEEKGRLNVPALKEQQRMTDVKAKMARLLADCDLLILPRMTLRNVADDFENIPGRLYKLDEAQVEAIKDFVKAGKPVLACFGPNVHPPEEGPGRLDDDRPDGVEQLLGELGVKFGKEAVLFDSEVEALAESRAGAELGGGQFEPPPVLFDWRRGEGRPEGTEPPPDRSNRIRDSLRLMARALGRDEEGKNLPLDLHIRHPRPIYFVPPKGAVPDADPDFLMTSPRSWNEDQPFPTADSVPQFERPKSRDNKVAESAKDPYEKRRRGPFPVGIAFEARLPEKWFDSAADRPTTPVRLAVIGQGGFFTGKKLPPAQEKLFVNTINWLLGRDDELPSADRVWSFPRVNDTIPPGSQAEDLWRGGLWAGLPGLAVFLGCVMLLFRRLR